MHFMIASAVLLCSLIGETNGRADGWIDLGGLPVPTGECVIDSSAIEDSYIFSCNDNGTMSSAFYSGVTDCSSTPVNSLVSGTDYNCSPVGYVTIYLEINNPFTGGDCAIAYGTSAIATGVCNSNVMYVIYRSKASHFEF